MGEMFDDDGRLNIPILEKLNLTDSKLEIHGAGFVIKDAFCPKGHSLMCDTIVDKHKGIKLYITDIDNKKKADVAISPLIGAHNIVTLSGDVFEQGVITKVHCSVCHTELEVIHDCECGGYMYVFYMDNHLDRNFGVSFCSRIGCIKSSRLRFSKDVIIEYLRDHIL